MSMADWRRWRQLAPADRRLLLAALFWLPCMRLGLRWLGFKRLHQWVSHSGRPQPAQPADESLARARAIEHWVDLAARRGLDSGTCLSRSLTLLKLLQKADISGCLRIGVRMTEQGLDAHAWVEVANEPVNERPDVSRRYATYRDGLQADVRAFR